MGIVPNDRVSTEGGNSKYRVDESEYNWNRFGSPGPPEDAINALHRYRDAIALDSTERGLQRPVVKGAALFSLSANDSTGFRSSSLWKALEVLGVVALPLLPTNKSYREAWLDFLFALSPEDLAEPGPPFAGLAEKSRRQIDLLASSSSTSTKI
jgi:hypothetical protein